MNSINLITRNSIFKFNSLSKINLNFINKKVFLHHLKNPTFINSNKNDLQFKKNEILNLIKRNKTSIEVSKENPKTQLSTEQKVKQAGKDTMYTGVIILGVGMTCFLFYTIGKELFSSQSPNGIYTSAYKMAINDKRIIDVLGAPIKAHGIQNTRGRRNYVSFNEYMEDGKKAMELNFYLDGSVERSKVFVVAKQDDKNKYKIRLVVAEILNFPHKTITIYDERDILTPETHNI